MSQQNMQFEEANRGYTGVRDDGFVDQQQYRSFPDQKIGGVTFTTSSGRGAPAGMRLALGIVSVAMLVPLLGITIGLIGAIGGAFGAVFALIALGMVCLTIMVVNIAFNTMRN